MTCVQRRALAEAAALARGAALHGDDGDSSDDDVYGGMHLGSGVLLDGFEHMDVDEIMVPLLACADHLPPCPGCALGMCLLLLFARPSGLFKCFALRVVLCVHVSSYSKCILETPAAVAVNQG